MNKTHLQNTAKSEESRRAISMMAVLALGAFALMPEMAMAAPWDNAANHVLGIFTNGLTRTLAIIAVIACGIMALAGKLAWDRAIHVILGIVLIFGSASIVDYFASASSV